VVGDRCKTFILQLVDGNYVSIPAAELSVPTGKFPPAWRCSDNPDVCRGCNPGTLEIQRRVLAKKVKGGTSVSPGISPTGNSTEQNHANLGDTRACHKHLP